MAMEIDDTSDDLAKVGCGPRRRLHINWGAGNELHVCDVSMVQSPAVAASRGGAKGD